MMPLALPQSGYGCRPPCECGRPSSPSAAASTRRRRLVLLGWRVAWNVYLGLQMVSSTNPGIFISKMVSISTYLNTCCRIHYIQYTFLKVGVFFPSPDPQSQGRFPRSMVNFALKEPLLFVVKGIAWLLPGFYHVPLRGLQLLLCPAFQWASWQSRPQ